MHLLKWAGSKKNSAKEILPYLDFNRPYYEPFCGSASFFMMSEPEKAVLNDYNSALMSFYASVRSSPKRVWDVYNGIDVSESSYYLSRDRFNVLRNGHEKAGIFLYLNHYCFNGIYRTNKSGKFNTPFGAKKKIKKKISFEDFMVNSKRLLKVELYSLDFEDFLIKSSPKNSMIYVDPPYFTNDQRVFSEYSERQFSLSDLDRLSDVLDWCALRGNKVVVSYKDCSEFREIFGQHIVGEVNVQRNVGGFSGRRKKDSEVVAVLGV